MGPEGTHQNGCSDSAIMAVVPTDIMVDETDGLQRLQFLNDQGSANSTIAATLMSVGRTGYTDIYRVDDAIVMYEGRPRGFTRNGNLLIPERNGRRRTGTITAYVGDVDTLSFETIKATLGMRQPHVGERLSEARTLHWNADRQMTSIDDHDTEGTAYVAARPFGQAGPAIRPDQFYDLAWLLPAGTGQGVAA